MPPLCYLCRHIDFAAILTPREHDHNGRQKTPFLQPTTAPQQHAARHSQDDDVSFYPRLPILSNIAYENLSDSEGEKFDRPYKTARVGRNHSQLRNQSIEKTSNGECLNRTVSNQSEPFHQRVVRDIESQSTRSTSSDESHLMEFSEIDLKIQSNRRPHYHAGQFYNLGSIFDVRSRRHECMLCRRLWLRMRTFPEVKNSFMFKSKAILKLVEFEGRRHSRPKDRISMLNLLFIFGWKIEQHGDWTMRNSFIIQGRHLQPSTVAKQQMSRLPLPFNDDLYGQARVRHSQCDFNLIKAWLKTCELQHDHQILIRDGQLLLRFVDVHRLCVVEWKGSTSEVPRYVALSYTWGSSKPKVQLTTTSIASLQIVGALDVPLNDTLADAITLTRNIGERYIWIDCLSIIQDSGDDQLRQIPNMHQVYARSVLTIVAGVAPDANHGLPRVRTQNALRFNLKLSDIEISFRGTTKVHFGSTQETVGIERNYLCGTRYLSRAWTYQEGYLAPRVLVFTEDRVFWECDRCTWCEETHWESSEIDYVGQRAIKQAMPQEEFNDAFDRKAYDLTEYDDAIFNFDPDNYAAIIKEYTSRNLSFSTDIMHACSGVIRALSQRDDASFFHGLRTRYFGNDILFNINRFSFRRFEDGSSLSGITPSWAWAYWHGMIEIANQPRHNSYDLVENLVPCDGVKCYMLWDDPTTKERTLSVINKHGGWRFEADYVRTGEGIYNPADEITYTNQSAEIDESRLDQSSTVSQIRSYRQDLTIDDIKGHREFDKLLPCYHIIFRTFVSLVIVITEYDELSAIMSEAVIGGTCALRGNGVWSNRDSFQRKIYVVKRASASPVGYKRGPYIGHLPPFSQSFDETAYKSAVPDGMYVLLWMNNNQLPMFGHLLCRPKNPSAKNLPQWRNEVLERVCGVTGATDVLHTEKQSFYGAKWGTVILG